MDSDYSLNEQEKGNVFIFTAYQYIFSPLSLTGIVNELWTNNPDDAESGWDCGNLDKSAGDPVRFSD